MIILSIVISLFVVQLAVEVSEDVGWISTVDFMKAFDSISHRSLWDAVGHCVIEPQYVGPSEETL